MPSLPEQTLDAIGRIIAAGIARNHFAGAVALVEQAGGERMLRAFGHACRADIPAAGDAAQPMRADHIFDLASMTKALAGTLGAMHLYEQGQLRLDAPVADYLPAFARASDKGSVRVEHLLSHTSGLPAWAPMQCLVAQRQEAPAFVAGQPLAHLPGSRRVYSDLGYMTLGFIIEAIAQEPLDAFLARSIFGPMGLESMGFNPCRRGLAPLVTTSFGNALEKDMVKNPASPAYDPRAQGFTGWRQRWLKGEVNDANAFHALGGVSAHAGLFANAQDIAAIGQMLIQDGVYRSQRIFSAQTCETFLAPAPHPFGWVTRRGRASLEGIGGEALPPRTIFMQGFTGTYARICCPQKSSVVLLTNRLHVPRQTGGSYANITPLFADMLAQVDAAFAR